MVEASKTNMLDKLKQARDHQQKDFLTEDMYPRDVIMQAMFEATAPRCIFIPDRDLLRRMIKAVAFKDPMQKN